LFFFPLPLWRPKMSVADINGYAIDGGGPEGGQPYFRGRSSLQASARLGSIMVLLAPHQAPQASQLDDAKSTKLFVRQMMALTMECFQSALDWCEYQEKEAELKAQLGHDRDQAAEQLRTLYENPPSPMDAVMTVNGHDISHTDLINGAMVAREIKTGLGNQPRLLKTRAQAGPPLWSAPRGYEQLVDKQQAPPTTSASYANATRGRGNLQQRRAPVRDSGNRMESAEYEAHREKVSAAVAEVAVQKGADGAVTTYDPRKAREMFASKEYRRPPRAPQDPINSLIVSGLPADFEYADAREMLRQVVPSAKVEVLRLPFVQPGDERYMLLKLPSVEDATDAMQTLNAVTLANAGKPMRARYAKRTVLGRDEYRAFKAARVTEAVVLNGRVGEEPATVPWDLEEYARRYKCLMTTVARAEKSSINFIFLNWVAELAEEMFAGEGQRVAKAFMADAPTFGDALSNELSYAGHTADRIRAARDAVLHGTHLAKHLHEITAAVEVVKDYTDETKKEQVLANFLYPAVAEVIQGRMAGDATRYFVRKGAQCVLEMCKDARHFTTVVKTFESAVDSDGDIRAAVRKPRNMAVDDVDFSPLSSPISLFERWTTTWNDDTEPQKRKSLAWKTKAIKSLVELYAPRDATADEKTDMITVLTANTDTERQDWFSGMLVHPENSFTRATAAIRAGVYHEVMQEYLRGGLGGGAIEPRITPATLRPVLPEQELHLGEKGPQDNDDITVQTSNHDNSDESTIVIPDTPPAVERDTDSDMDTDQAWSKANEQASAAESGLPTGEKRGRLSSPTSGELYPTKRSEPNDQLTSVPDSQPMQPQRAAGTTRRTTTTSVSDQPASGKKGTPPANKSGRPPASQGDAKPPSRATSTSAIDQALGKAH
jgi:hypothetical protein